MTASDFDTTAAMAADHLIGACGSAQPGKPF